MIVFFAYTQYHLFNILNLKFNLYPDKDCELVLYNIKSGNTEMLYKRLKTMHIFKHVYVINNDYLGSNIVCKIWLRITRYIKPFYNYHMLNRWYANKECELIYSYGSAMEFYLLYEILKRKNNNLKWFCYEEGSGTYHSSIENALPKFTQIYLKKVFSLNMPECADQYFIYEPLCFASNKTKVSPMPKVLGNKSLITIYRQVFHVDSSCSLRYNWIFFEQPFGGKLDKIQNNIMKQLKNFDVAVKLHPRTEAFDKYKNMSIVNSGNTPWEMVCLNSKGLGDKILISVNSTACITPKMIFDEEPVIIFLCRMEEVKGVIDFESFDLFIERFKKSYKNPERIIFPKNKKELLDIIKSYKDRNR